MSLFGRNNKESEAKPSAIKGIFTKELFGMVLILFSTLMLVCLITRDAVFSTVGLNVNAFLFGVFGYTAFVFCAFLIYLGAAFILDKSIPILKSNGINLLLTVFSALFLVHSITTSAISVETYGEYLKGTYLTGAGGAATASLGGIIFSLISFIPLKLIAPAGTYAVFALLTAVFAFLTVKEITGLSFAERKQRRKDDSLFETRDYPIDGSVPEMKSSLYVRDDDFELMSKKEQAFARKTNQSFTVNYPNKTEGSTGLGYGEAKGGESFTEEAKRKLFGVSKTAPKLEVPDYSKQYYARKDSTVSVSRPINNAVNTPKEENKTNLSETEERLSAYNKYTEIEEVEDTFNKDSFTSEGYERNENYGDTYTENYAETLPEEKKNYTLEEVDYKNADSYGDTESTYAEKEPSETVDFRKDYKEYLENLKREREEKARKEREKKESESRVSSYGGFNERQVERKETPRYNDNTEKAASRIEENKSYGYQERVNSKPQNEEKEEVEEFNPPCNVHYNAPPLTLLKVYPADVAKNKDEEENVKAIIERTLAEFGIQVTVDEIVRGPSVTRYEFKMPYGVSVNRIPPLSKDISARLASAKEIRIQAPIPGKDSVGIEVPNRQKTTVGLRDIMESPKFQIREPDALTMALGKDIVGNAISDNLVKGIHYLVAGATGMGKSVCLNIIILSLIMKYSPEELRLILVDPKQVEFSAYAHIPHLLIDEIIKEKPRAIAALQWAVDEMTIRYRKFDKCGVRNIGEYNETVANETTPKMPKIVVIVDEVNDLMMFNKKALEEQIIKLSQLARAAGIHLILATQRPSAEVITGVIKSNLPSRIAFAVKTATESNIILGASGGSGGAESLLGDGDMLYNTPKMSENLRIQGAYVSKDEISAVVDYIKEHNESYFNTQAAAAIENIVNPPAEKREEDDDDFSERDVGESKLFIDALKMCIMQKSASVSAIRRRFSVGFSKAGNLIDQMERLGYISAFDGSKARQVYMTMDEFNQKYGSGYEEE